MRAGPPGSSPDPPPVLPVPAPVREIAETLERAGYETWCVGGAVRDALLGHPHLDWDLATQATPSQIRHTFRRTIPVGVEHGTVGVLDREGRMHEVTTFRKDVQTDGRHAKVEFGASLDEDLARRDFTINAIAYHPTRQEIRDPFGGRRDLAARLLRAVGEPDERMREDRLRALRAIRFASRFDFQIDAPTWEAIVRSAPHLRKLSAERVKQEIEKTMEQVERPGLAIRRWLASGAMAALVPALAAMPEELTVALDCLPRPAGRSRPEVAEGRKKNRLAALFLAAPGSRAAGALKELRFSNTDVAWIGSLVGAWQELEPAMTAAMLRPEPPGDGEIRRWAARAGRTRLGPLLRLAAALW
ncbi:MAG TPA: CCA tRNA nucleotidyltransferase, partial [Gemmatimonadaceae bacterium]|nr:CCA tRNA nucleotidyltransferase [Gemmatimonadaceae bacterium]